jgi:polyvinyl alcohol dehydrogenase (cytochrome)
MWGRTITRDFSTNCPGLTTKNAADLKRIWFFNTYDVVTATPAVVGDTIYVGDWAGRFYAIRRSDGSVRWTYRTPPAPHVYAGQIVSSAAVVNIGGEPTVYFGGGKTLYALRARDGHLRWKHAIGKPGDAGDYSEIEASPVVVEGLVIVGWDVHNDPSGRPSGVLALDAKTGTVRWRTVFAPTHGQGATGSGCGDVWGSAAVDTTRRMVFVGTGNCVSARGWGRFSEAIVALGLDDGAVKWTYQPHQPNRDDLDFAGAPNLFEANGRALVGLGNKDGTYYVVDRDSGAPVWSRHVADPGLVHPGSNFSTGGFIGPAAYADGTIVGGTAIGGAPYLHALDAATGAIKWQQPEAAATYGAAAVANGVVVIGGTDFTMRALDLATGNILWSDAVKGAVSGGAVIVGDDVISVAGIREPGLDKRSRTSGVYRYSLHGTPVTSTTVKQKPGTGTTTPAPKSCTGTRNDVPFDLIKPPPGTNPKMTLTVSTNPWCVEVRISGAGPPRAWLRPGSPAARAGATRYGVFISESDDNPQGGLLCVLDPGAETTGGSCTSSVIPRPGATYSRITVLAITDSDALPTPQEGVNRLVVTKSFAPALAPVAKK